MELTELPIPATPDDEMLERLGRALYPIVEAEGDASGATEAVRGDLLRLMDLELELRAQVDQATATSKEIIETTLPPYWPHMLGSAMMLALSGFLIMAKPELRLPFIAFIGLLLLGLIAHYAWRLASRARRIKPMQERFDAADLRSHDLFHELSETEQALRARGFELETESYLPFRPVFEVLADPGADGEALRRRLARFVTGDVQRHSEDAPEDGADG